MRFRMAMLALVSLFGVLIGTAVVATPAQAGRSTCPAAYVCAWADASWMGTWAAYDPGYIYNATPSHCLNINNTSLQDAISSMASYSSWDMKFYKDANCYELGGYWFLPGSAQVKDLKGTGYNDSFSSVSVPGTSS